MSDSLSGSTGYEGDYNITWWPHRLVMSLMFPLAACWSWFLSSAVNTFPWWFNAVSPSVLHIISMFDHVLMSTQHTGPSSSVSSNSTRVSYPHRSCFSITACRAVSLSFWRSCHCPSLNTAASRSSWCWRSLKCSRCFLSCSFSIGAMLSHGCLIGQPVCRRLGWLCSSFDSIMPNQLDI